MTKLKPQIVIKLKKYIVTSLEEHKNSKTPTVTKSKISKYDKTQKHKLQQNSITQIATKLKT